MDTAGITFIKLGVIPLYNPRGPSFCNIVFTMPDIVPASGVGVTGINREDSIKIFLVMR